MNPTVCKTREEWLEARKGSIGASDAAAALGVSPWKSPLQLYGEMTGAIEHKPANVAMRRGSALEPLIVELWEEQTGQEAEDLGEFTIIRPEDPELSFLHATLDRRIEPTLPTHVLGKPGVLECKTFNRFALEDWEDGIPDPYHVQVHQQLICTGWEWGQVAGLTDDRLIVHDFTRSADIVEWMIEGLTEFWQRVQDKNPPPADHRVSAKAIAAMYPEDEGSVIDLSATDLQLEPGTMGRLGINVLDETHLTLDSAIGIAIENAKEAKKAVEELKNRMRQLMGTATVGVLPDGAGRWKYATQQRKEYVVKASSPRVLRRLKR